MKIQKQFRRVDVQVSILCMVITIFCTVCVYILGYSLTYQDMLHGLEDRVFAIHDYLDDTLDKNTFYDINRKEDMKEASYQTVKKLLESVKECTQVRYLYTAKKNQDGEFIYVVDGLDEQAGDFRYPGDPIEPEICEDMERALNDEQVLPDAIKSTDWGKIFITYLPIHDGDEVVGVLGIEFEAGHQYNTYRNLKLLLPAVILAVCLLATAAAFLFFRRISNPTYRDMSNTDHLTQLKNRNAFETDIHNLEGGRNKKRVGLIVADLNHLKMVNDRQGHGSGDRYIITAGQVIQKTVSKNGVAYRLGGDEYAVLLPDTNEEKIKEYMEQIGRALKEKENEIAKGIPLSMSMGYSIYDKDSGESMAQLFGRADTAMYEQKKEFHERETRKQREE